MADLSTMTSELDECDLATLVLLADHANRQPCVGAVPREVLTLMVGEYATNLFALPSRASEHLNRRNS